MSREIEFRAWDKDRNEMTKVYEIQWYFGELYKVNGERNVYELMQSTGLLDKNGVEIYEGDIVDADFVGYLYITGAVEWSFNNAAFGIKNKDWYEMLNGIKSIEVIGNIYESPNLLTQKKES